MCPHCRQNAPLVYRGVMAYCTACGAPRLPLTDASVTLAGKPAKLGGTLARGIGWLVLIGGLSLGLMIGLLAFALAGTPAMGLAFGLPVALSSGLIGWLLLRSGRALSESGADEERSARLRALGALAAHRGGVVRSAEVAHALEMRVDEADAFLTNLAKTQPDLVTLELDDVGGYFYRVSGGPGAPLPARWPEGGAVRIDAAEAPARVAVPADPTAAYEEAAEDDARAAVKPRARR